MRFLLLLLVSFSDTNAPIVIAHRGASGYAIEHTEAAKTLAHAQDADFIEQDVVLSKDNQFIVTHDITMDETTNVAELFPTRARSDARFYFADFDWTEIQKLTVHERSSRNTSAPAIPGRFPYIAGQHVMKLVDEIQLINGLKTSDRGYKRYRYAVLRTLNCPGALLEAAYLSNDTEAARLGTGEFRQRIAETIAEGVQTYSATLAGLRLVAPPAK